MWYIIIPILLVILGTFLLIKFVPKKRKNKMEPSRVWKTREIIIRMWSDKESFFTKEAIDNYTVKSQEIGSIELEVAKEFEKITSEINEWGINAKKKDIPIDILDLRKMERDNYVNLQAKVNDVSNTLEKSLFKIRAGFAKVGLKFELLESIKSEVITPDFLSELCEAIEDDVSWVESHGGKKRLKEIDSVCYSFVDSILSNLKDESISKFKKRYK